MKKVAALIGLLALSACGPKPAPAPAADTTAAAAPAADTTTPAGAPMDTTKKN